MQAIWQQLLDLLFPPRCAGCGQGGAWFCAACIDRCAPLSADDNIRHHARLASTALTTSTGVFAYTSPLREAIHTLKYERRHILAKPLGTYLVEGGRSQLPSVDAVVPVPLFRDRLYDRGFNQAVLLARIVAHQLELPLLDRPLRRTRSTNQQARLDDRAERQANVKDAFAWHGPPPPPRILLVDDVLTTGATMEACAAALCSAGAVEVHGLALARGGS